MRKSIQLFALLVLGTLALHAQVTQLNNNKSLTVQFPIGNKALLVSGIDSTLWVTDATPAGTVQITTTIKFVESGGPLNNKLVFVGTTPATGQELYITDGTTAGTVMIKDIYPGATGSLPGSMAELNGLLYFSAETAAEGRELWKTDGTTAGTTLVKDIVPGITGSNTSADYDIFSTGTYLLLTIKTAAEGNELWKSDGTAAGTALLKDINVGTAASNPGNFHWYNNMVLFSAKTAANGIELWKTDGTTGGTVMVKDINAGIGNGFSNVFFFDFIGRAFFTANDGTTGDEIWSTDGTTANTTLLKDIASGPFSSYASLFTGVKVGSRLIFSAFTISEGFELWETDGTTAGTKLFKDIIPGSESSMASIFPVFSWGSASQPLFQGNKFFFMATTVAEGSELWVSDGTSAGTHIVKDINPGTADGLASYSFIYTTTAVYFSATDGVHGDELWKSDGTVAGTTMVADINTGAPDADIFFSFFMVNNKVLFEATNGDDPTATDLYKIDVDLAPLPLQLVDFTASPMNADALLNWTTLQEVNTKDFSVQRSLDGVHFETIGMVAAAGSSPGKQVYSFTDKGIMHIAKNAVYYRLLVKDKDGNVAATKVLSIKINGGWGVSLTGNPVRGNTLGVLVSGVNSATQLSIVDASGKLMLKQTAPTGGLFSLPAQNLMPGVYVLLAQNNGETKTIRFVKQ